MAVEANAASDRVTWGDSDILSASAITISVIYRTAASLPATGGRIFCKWGVSSPPNNSFIIHAGLSDASQLVFNISEDGSGGGTLRTLTTGASTITTSTTYRIAARWRASDNNIEMYVNGSDAGGTASGTGAASMFLTGASEICVGDDYALLSRGATGQFSEAGIWNAYLSNADMVALTSGFAPPMVSPNDLVFYAPLYNTSYNQELVQGFAGTNTSVTDVPHPSMINPSSSGVQTFPPPIYEPAAATVPPIFYHHRHHNLSA